MKRLKYLILLLSLLLSNACTNITPIKNGVTLAPVKQSDASDYLNFAEFFANASTDLQKKTLANTNQTLALNANDLLSRMKLVIMYSATGSFMHDAPKAQYLLQQILQENILIETQLAFANLLFDHLTALNKINKTSRQEDKRAFAAGLARCVVADDGCRQRPASADRYHHRGSLWPSARAAADLRCNAADHPRRAQIHRPRHVSVQSLARCAAPQSCC